MKKEIVVYTQVKDWQLIECVRVHKISYKFNIKYYHLKDLFGKDMGKVPKYFFNNVYRTYNQLKGEQIRLYRDNLPVHPYFMPFIKEDKQKSPEEYV